MNGYARGLDGSGPSHDQEVLRVVLVATVHDRQPVILRPQHEALWLDPPVTDPADLAPVWEPYPAELIRAYAVGRRVNSPAYHGPECVAPVA
jgi:putative SOS response-associated peptidase YedK